MKTAPQPSPPAPLPEGEGSKSRSAFAPHSPRDGAVSLGPYIGEVAERFRTPAIVARLAEFGAWLDSPAARTIGRGRNRHVRIEGLLGDGGPDVIVKAFGTRTWLHDAWDQRIGSKARRSWLAAEHLRRKDVGTPAPVAYLERWENERLRESHFVAVYQANVQTFRDALITLFHDHPDAELFLPLLECVANGVRAMHDAGFVHNDLGNQNILLTPVGPGHWQDFQIVDLNRGRIRPGALDLRERARDLSRMALPSHLLQVFTKMYWQETPPREFVRWLRLGRRLHGWRVRSRRWRHPLREARLKREAATDPASRRGYPHPRDMWIWDERCGQPLHAMLRDERVRQYPPARMRRLVVDAVRAAPRVWQAYGPLVEGAYRHPVAMAGGVGMAVDPSSATCERELALLERIGRIPVLVRFYHHETRERCGERIALVNALHRAGHPVAAAIVQDRNAVRNAAAWREFLIEVLDGVAAVVDTVEVGHCINRTKWGIWDFDDVRALYAPLPELHARHPTIRFAGPAAIDFEYTFVLSALREWPQGVPLSALSHHLYVDRRGAPEAPQGGFGLVEKLALARAIARTGPGEDRLIVSEVNWPLMRSAPYSPIGPPWIFPSQGPTDKGATEDEYADCMIRYLALALASGLAERVYWWRLVSRGFGLVDDGDSTAWRERPAFGMLRTFQALLGESTFVSARLPARAGNRHGRHRLAFRRSDGETVVLTWAHGPDLRFPDDETFARVEDAFGRAMDRAPATLTGRPVYLREDAA